MAFPQIVASNFSGEESDVTTHGVDLPATVNAGELLLIYASINDPRTFTAPTGWTLIRELAFDLNAGAVFGKVAAGTEGGTSVTFDTSGTTRSAHYSIAVSGWGGALTSVEVSAGFGQGSTVTHNPDAVTASWGADDNLFIASAHVRKGGSRVVTAWPTDYTSNQLSYKTAANSGGALIAIASRELASATDDPSTFTTDVDSTNSVSFTTVIKPASAVGTGPSQVVENFTAADSTLLTALPNGWDAAANSNVNSYALVSNAQFSGFVGSRPSTAPTSADQRVNFVVTAASQRPMAVALRLSSDDQNGYFVQPAGGNMELRKIVNGTVSTITTAALDTTLPTAIEFSVIGDQIKVLADGVQIISATDTEVVAAHSWGVANYFSPANNTNPIDSLVFEDAASVDVTVDQIITGSTPFDDTAGTENIDVTLPNGATVDSNRSVIQITTRNAGGDERHARTTFYGEILDPTTIRFARHESGFSTTGVIEWTVIEFSARVIQNIQTGTVDRINSVESVSITPVDPNKTFVLLGFKTSQQNINTDIICYAEITGASNDTLNLSSFSTPASGESVAHYQIVEFSSNANVNVQNFKHTFTQPEITHAQTINAVDPKKTFIINGGWTGGETFAVHSRNACSVSLTDSTTVSIDKANDTTYNDVTVSYYVVELTGANNKVEEINVSIADGSSTPAVQPSWPALATGSTAILQGFVLGSKHRDGSDSSTNSDQFYTVTLDAGAEGATVQREGTTGDWRAVAYAVDFSTTETDIYISFGIAGDPSPAPWSYNLIIDDKVGVGVASSDLKDSNNKSTGITLSVINPFQDGTGGTTTADTGVGEWPQEVFDYYWYAGSSFNPATLRFDGFGAGDTYRLELAGHQISSATRDTTYSIVEGDSAVYDATGTVNPNAPIVLTGTIVNSSFDLDVSLINTFGYLSGAKLTFTRNTVLSQANEPRKHILASGRYVEEIGTRKGIVDGRFYESTIASATNTLAGDILGTGTATGTLPAGGAILVGDAAGTGTATGALTVPADVLVGDVSGTGTATGALTVPADSLAGDATGVGVAIGSLTVPADVLRGDVSGTGSMTGNLVLPADNLQGDAAGTANLVGQLVIPADTLQGDATGVSVVIGSLTVPADVLRGDAAGSGTLTGTLAAPTVVLQGDVSGTGTLSGNLIEPPDVLQGDVSGTATVTGALSTGALLIGTVNATATITAAFRADLGWELALQKAIYETLIADGDLAPLVTGVYDNAPQSEAAFPYITLGEDIFNEFDTDTDTGVEVNVTIHVWSRYKGRKEVKLIQAAVYSALNRANLNVQDAHFISSDFLDSTTLVESDGMTRHGVQRFKILLDEV